MAKYPDWIRPIARTDIGNLRGSGKTLEEWLTELAPGTHVDFMAGRAGVDYRSPSSESTIGPAAEAWDLGRHAARRLGLDLWFGVAARMDVYWPSPFQAAVSIPDPAFVGQVTNGAYTKRENLYLRAGYTIGVDPRLPLDFVDAVQNGPDTSPAWYSKAKGSEVQHYAWVLDWRVPGCMEWTRAWVVELLSQFRPDYINVAAKTGWHMHGSPRLQQPGETQSGDFCPSFYGEGEYEALLREQTHWLLDQGYAVTVADRPSADGTQATCGVWADERIRQEVVGWQ